eukprot:g11053.t1 g11053   contig48:41235-42609(-)
MYHHHCLGIHRANPSTSVTIVILMVLWLLFHFPSLHPLQQQQEQQQQHIDASTMIKGETNLPLPSASEISSGSDAVNPNHPLAKIALVHAGIHKTGTTTIQQLSKVHINELKRDGYEMPWVAKEENNRFPCDPNLLLHGLDIAKRNRNLFVSAETLSKIDIEGVNLLSSYLAHWQEVTIVIYYRRFFDWFISVYNQISKSRKITDTVKWNTSIIDFAESHVGIYNANSSQYTPFVVDRLKTKFDNIVVANYHDKSEGELDESFFCNIMPNATHTCNAIRSQTKHVKFNAKENIDYSDLAYGAKQAGLVEINSDQDMRRFAKKIEDHHEKALNGAPFRRECLPSHVLEEIWNITLTSEMWMLPSSTDTALAEMRADFEIASNTKLCKVDVRKTLSDPSWIQFFGH